MIRIGVLGTSSIAERRMIPAIKKEPAFQYAGVAYSTREEMAFEGSAEAFEPLLRQKLEKAERFQQSFGGQVWAGYGALISNPEIDAVYIALPPALHFRWASEALSAGKHVLLEKPFTTRNEDTKKLVALARKQQLAVVENYGFPYHAQMELIRQWMAEDAIGELRQVRATFGFPHRSTNDFRYNRALGGGALLDCGGYTIRAATAVLGSDIEVLSVISRIQEEQGVDLFGSALLRHASGVPVVLAFGMDHDYHCELELWGSKGTITASRIFTAPDNYPAPVDLKNAQGVVQRTAKDDQFLKILNQFGNSIISNAARKEEMDKILLQSALTEKIREKSNQP